LAVAPGAIGSVGFSGVVQPQEPQAFSITTGLSLLFVISNNNQQVYHSGSYQIMAFGIHFNYCICSTALQAPFEPSLLRRIQEQWWLKNSFHF
jgi:hypothetical protein